MKYKSQKWEIFQRKKSVSLGDELDKNMEEEG